MTKPRPKKPNTIPINLIAPSGMNCRLCYAYIREKNICPGCRGDNDLKAWSCVNCKIITCERIATGKAKFCFGCDRFPCARLKQLDKRYRTKYGMSMIANLDTIQESGIRHFIRNEKEKWTCPECGELISVHKPECLSCGYRWH